MEFFLFQVSSRRPIFPGSMKCCSGSIFGHPGSFIFIEMSWDNFLIQSLSRSTNIKFLRIDICDKSGVFLEHRMDFLIKFFGYLRCNKSLTLGCGRPVCGHWISMVIPGMANMVSPIVALILRDGEVTRILFELLLISAGLNSVMEIIISIYG